MSDFVKEIHAMFDHIWDCEIDHPVYQDTVGELMEAVIQAYEKHKPTLGTNLASLGTDCISRQAAIEAIDEYFERIGKLKRRGLNKGEKAISLDTVGAIKSLPPAQPERRCVNCGRTVNNGGWYEDGRTRCPIEEHYALPKDGYCHLWEKRNVTDDDYPERRTDG